MTTMIVVYKGHQMTAVEQPQGGWAAEIASVGGGGKPWLIMVWPERSDAMAAARRMIDNGVRQ
jgi:hypothetical protein